ncbi:uncharacterized protein C8Q71DRAFT_859565 [Rhodofomes roseus]|uniref:Hemerythrin-like domain-containing protein n=1 Tax=Rhodofomes roseus TaxID=34475 RepID=A0ABQ8KAV8_9APHY|nr:uncharacterized protein C8Q71DRAFT_859565 [Rhodofomes roseus]KAH9834588.1 hypothetical protein C8Q71DRAFT_859565 [Rhodofomes roseus]
MASVPALRKALAYFEEPSRGPVPADIYEAQYWEMAGAHACLMNGLLNVYQKATSVPTGKEADFVGYALQWVAALEHHHHWEETIYYPLFNPKFDTSAIVAEHATFTEGMHAFETYLVSCLPPSETWGYGQVAGPHEQQPYDGERLTALVDAFVEPLTKHFMQEITYLEPAKLRASGLTEEEVKHIADVSTQHMKEMPPTTFLVYTIIHTPPSSGFPPVPGFVKSFLGPYVFALPNRRYWQFAPKNGVC